MKKNTKTKRVKGVILRSDLKNLKGSWGLRVYGGPSAEVLKKLVNNIKGVVDVEITYNLPK